MSGVRPGDVIAGKFRVERVLGEGGMGYVVAAKHLQLGQMVALKFMRDEVCTPAYKSRFLREARNTVRLKSKHVSRVLDVGSLEGGAPYMVMEYLEGTDLSDLLHKRGPVPVQEACEYILQACEAIAEAHGHGIVHRDLKPANLFLTRGQTGEPVVKVLDFGVSKVLGHGGTLTAGRVVGTPGYMAPEQARGEDVDKRADTFSLAAIAYRCLTGHPPFTGKDVPTTLYEVSSKMPTQPSQLHDDLPRDVDRALAIGLAKDPRHRFPDATAFADALVAAFAERLSEDLRRMGELRIAVHPWGQRVAPTDPR
jgi:serine/threonine-protein kinase